jgi:MFS transporter, DHA1 family, multidrug resistance protein
MVASVGFSFTFPFIPLFVQDLGVTDAHEIEKWAGLLAFAGGLSMAISSPVWGAVADRYGRKAMVLRSMLGGAVLLGLMGMVQNVEQLFVLRFIQGAITGVSAASAALVTTFTPRARLGMALGLMQVSLYAGFSFGPMVGGLIADNLGFRYSFYFTAVLLALSGLLVLFLVEEGKEQLPTKAQASGSMFAGLGEILRLPFFLAIIGAFFGIQGSNATVAPILPLYVQSLTTGGQSAAASVGLIMGASGLASAVASLAIGRVSDRLGHRRILAFCTLGAGLAYLPQTLATDTTQLLLLQVVLGLFIGGMLPSVNALTALEAPSGAQGAAFGLSATAAALAMAVGPLLGAFLATTVGQSSVFVAAGVLILVTGGREALARRPATKSEY